MDQREQQISDKVRSEHARLWQFIRKRILDESEAEDILQDVLCDFVEAYRLPEPIEQIGAWLFRVARNRIIDRYRKKREQPLPDLSDEANELWLEGLLPVVDGPEAAFVREFWLKELQAGLSELPDEQRNVFIAHELEGKSFEQLAKEQGVKVNTLLSRKRAAALYLRQRMQLIYEEILEEDWK